MISSPVTAANWQCIDNGAHKNAINNANIVLAIPILI
jgi:hypothetical protein